MRINEKFSNNELKKVFAQFLFVSFRVKTVVCQILYTVFTDVIVSILLFPHLND
jgi:hypothetical protein